MNANYANDDSLIAQFVCIELRQPSFDQIAGPAASPERIRQIDSLE